MSIFRSKNLLLKLGIQQLIASTGILIFGFSGIAIAMTESQYNWDVSGFYHSFQPAAGGIPSPGVNLGLKSFEASIFMVGGNTSSAIPLVGLSYRKRFNEDGWIIPQISLGLATPVVVVPTLALIIPLVSFSSFRIAFRFDNKILFPLTSWGFVPSLSMYRLHMAGISFHF